MEARDKAVELVDKFYVYCNNSNIRQEYAKQCALICVNEIIKALRKDLPEIGKGKGYWSSVKKEIQKTMTLKEKFDEIHQSFINGDFIATDLIKENCEQIADDYAIEFAEWLKENDCGLINKEILKIFKKEKGL